MMPGESCASAGTTPSRIASITVEPPKRIALTLPRLYFYGHLSRWWRARKGELGTSSIMQVRQGLPSTGTVWHFARRWRFPSPVPNFSNHALS
jgi:hypothetical protein